MIYGVFTIDPSQDKCRRGPHDLVFAAALEVFRPLIWTGFGRFSGVKRDFEGC